MLLSHTLTANYVNRIRVSLHKVANLKPSYVHRENTPRRMKLDELSVQDLDHCFIEFDCDPFSRTDISLKTIHTGKLDDATLQKDFESAKSVGDDLLKAFLDDRIFSRNIDFNATVHKNNRRNFLTPVATSKTSEQSSKSALMENKAMSKLVSLCLEGGFKLIDIMEYRITEECLPLFNLTEVW